MLHYLTVMAWAALAAAAAQQCDPATNQIVLYKNRTKCPIGILTSSSGMPIEYQEATYSLNSNLIRNKYFMDSMTHFVRERIPTRVVHAKGAGAFGFFEVTHDISHICKAKLFSKVGKKTQVAVRFSLALKEKGAADTARDVRGFAVKFYTEDGNFDIVGFSTPMYVYKDPLKFSPFVHAFKPNVATNLIDPNSIWDYLSLNPESLHMFLLIFCNYGIPDGYRHMPGFGIHTYEVVNEQGVRSYMRFHFYPDAGIKNLSVEEAGKIAALDPDYSTRDLYVHISKGDYPSWQMCVQILSFEDMQNAGFDVFDATKILPLSRYRCHPVGRLVLNRNPVNYFADVEQMAFCPGNLVRGIMGSPDKLFESRVLAYRDAQNYRLGANFDKIRVNCPFQSNVLTYTRDGVAEVGDNGGDGPNYYPNSFNGPVPYVDNNRQPLLKIYEDLPNNYDQAGDLYANGLTAQERNNLVAFMVESLLLVEDSVASRAIQVLTLIHSDLGNRVSKGLALNKPKCS